MFVDQVKILVQAGRGGDGAVSFHREKYVTRGGPDGGDGGKGGDVVFRATRNAHTLVGFRYTRKFFAEPGENGSIKNKTGISGRDTVIDVPVGTVVKRVDTGEILLDMFTDGESKILLRGGRGGKGNARFATPTRRAPRFSTPGQRCEAIEVQLELRTIADVGLVGLPNVGKSTILSVLTSARPKIANYHFTTLAPNLGVCEVDENAFVLADIPGLIEGASEGAGLGHDFLRHVERTRMLLHVLDASGCEGRDPIEDFETINRELAGYSERLAALPQIVAANKMDIPEAQEGFEALRSALEARGATVFPVSAATQEGFSPLLRAVVEQLKTLPEIEPFEESGEVGRTDVSRFEIHRDAEEIGVGGTAYIVSGPLVDDLLLRVNPDDSASMRYFQQQLIRLGIIAALRNKGAKEGDTVVMGDWDFDFVE